MFNKRTIAERLLAAALCLVLLVGMLPAGALPAFAAADSTVGTNEETTQPSDPTGETTAPSDPTGETTAPSEPPAGGSEEGTEPTENKKGEVTALIDGLEITDDLDGNITVSIADTLTLEWVPADASIGRTDAGWRVGFSIAAPEGMTDVTNTRFDHTKPDGEVLEDRVYTDYTDSTTLNMWPLITMDWVKLGDVIHTFVIDWNGDGTNVQTVELVLELDKLLLLDEDGKLVNHYGTVTNNLGVEATYDNPADIRIDVSGKKLKYDVENGGWIVTATVTAPAVVDPTKATVNGMPFSDDASKFSVEYTQTLTAENNAVNLIGEFDWDGNGEVDQVIAITGTVELEKADHTISFEKTAGSTKDELPLYYVESEYHRGFFGIGAYWGNTFTNIATSSLGAGVTYTVEVKQGEELTASVNNGEVSFEGKEGLLLITVKASGTDTHADAEAQYYLQITEGDKGTQNIQFNSAAVNKIKYNPETGYYDYSVDAETVDFGTVTYEITEGNGTVATVDADGKVTTLKAGTFTIKASVAESADFYGDDVTMTVTVEKAEQKIELVENNVVLENGTASYEIKLTETEKWFAANSAYSFVIDWDNTTLDENTTVDANGVITFVDADYGTLTVQVTRSGDDSFLDWPATVTLELKEAEFADGDIQYTISCGENCDHGNNGWHTGPVTITAEGFTLYKYSDTKADASPRKPQGNDKCEHDFATSVTTEGDGVHTIVLCVREGKKAEHREHTITVKIDTTPPKTESFKFEYSKPVTAWTDAGAYGAQAPLKVTVSAEDANSGVAYFTLTYTKADGTVVTLTENVVNGKAEFVIASAAEADAFDGYMTVTATDKAGITSDPVTDDHRVIIDNTIPTVVGSVTAPTSTVNGMPYYAEKAVYTIQITEKNFFDGAEVKIFDGGKQISVDNGWTADGDVWTATVTLDAEGVHELKVLYTDRSGNEMAEYAPGKITIDKTAPVVKLENTGDVALEDVCTNQKVTVKVTITETNFDASTVVATLSGINPTVAAHSVEFLNEDWTYENGAYVNYIVIGGDAIYTLEVECKDPAERNDKDGASFTVEMTPPTDVEITYSDDVWGTVLNIVTFGYYKETMTVEISASDLTSGVAKFFYRLSEDAEWQELLPTDNKVSFNIAPQYEGKVQYYVVDKAGNATEEFTGNATIIVDDVKPTISVTWPEAKLELDDGTLFYDGEVTATVIITEKNFFNGEPEGEISGVKVFDNNEEIAFNSENWTQLKDEEGNLTDSWLNTVTLKAEEDHILRIEYADRSKNPLVNEDESKLGIYESQKVTIDTINPVISLDLEETPDRLYFADTKVITLTVVERNFNADKVQINVTAKDVSGNDLDSKPARSEWVTASDGITHTITLTFDAEANYTLDVTYADEAGRESNDLAERLFTVDKTAPEGLTISYSTNVWGQIIDNLTFGYYNVPVEVTITANDSISGVRQFLYSYIRDAGVSGVNLEKLEALIAGAQVEQVNGSYTFQAKFQIPENVLEQINGKISFTAVDRAENQTTLADDKTLVVDNIRPNASVNYNAPVQTVDGVAYYAGNIEVTLTVIEANFFAEDVKVTVTKDGISYPVDVAWNNVSVDDHIGTFTLTEDGDYVVSVTYTDRSNNAMDQYQSGQLTIDTVIPVVNVSDIVNNSANTDKVYSFSITATDINFDVAGFQPHLQTVSRNANGYSTGSVDLGEAKVVAEGNTYTFEIENLEDDAIYTLTCTVKDLAGNTTTVVILEDGKSYEKVQFSINRNGSVFALGEYTEQLVNDYYAQNVTEDLEFIEVNVDELKSYAITLNGKELTEGTDYTVTPEGGNGLWMKYTYTVSKDLFAEEGEYLLVVSSTDKAGNNAFSDVKDASVSFVVDRTAPVITVSGMANNGRYQTDKQIVTLIPTDDGGALSSIVVRMVDDNGNMLKEILNLSGEALTEQLESGDGKLTFEIGEGLYQNVQVICTDSAAGANSGNVYNETFTNLSVSANAFMIFWANTGLRWGVIGGTGAAALAIIFLLLGKKKKKEDKAEAK